MATMMQRKPQQLSPFIQLHEQFDNLLKNFFDEDEFETSLNEMTWRPRMDVSENDEAFFVHLDLPGVNPEDVEISVTDNQLTVQGQREEETETRDKKFHRVERTFGSFFRSLMLPAGCDASEIDALSDNGVINITIPKTEQKKSKTIKIKPR